MKEKTDMNIRVRNLVTLKYSVFVVRASEIFQTVRNNLETKIPPINFIIF